MEPFTHEKQQRIWDREHQNPTVLLQMDQRKASSSVKRFLNFLQSHPSLINGIEMGCGKGRNLIWLAQQNPSFTLTGFDFSPHAIEVAQKRAEEAGVKAQTQFLVRDATQEWSLATESFDFAIDCTATTDIESKEGRAFAVRQMTKVLRKTGYLLVYAMSDADEYHHEMIHKSPAKERGAFFHPQTGKFEKVFSEEELDQLYQSLYCIEKHRIDKKAHFFGKEYACYLHYRIYQKR